MRVAPPLRHRRRQEIARAVELPLEAGEVPLERARVLAVGRAVVVARAAGEVGRLRVGRARERPPADPVAVHVGVAGEPAEPVEVLLREHLAAIERALRVRERVGHPDVHAEVEVGQDEHRRLQPLGEVERLDRQGEALLHRAREEQHVPRVAVGEERGGEDVALRGAGGEPGGGADPLHVEDHRRDLGVVGEPGELAHERDARSGGRGHRARAGPARADRHADRGELVLGLDDRERRLAVGADPVLAQVADERLDERGGRRDGVPAHHRDAGEERAHRRRRVAVHEDLPRGRVHPADHRAGRASRASPRARTRPAPRRSSGRAPSACRGTASRWRARPRAGRGRAAGRARRRTPCCAGACGASAPS